MDTIETDEVSRYDDFLKVIELMEARHKAGWQLGKVIQHSGNSQRDSFVASATLIWQKPEPSYTSLNYRG